MKNIFGKILIPEATSAERVHASALTFDDIFYCPVGVSWRTLGLLNAPPVLSYEM